MGRKAFQRALHFYVINDHPLRKKKKKKKSEPRNPLACTRTQCGTQFC